MKQKLEGRRIEKEGMKSYKSLILPKGLGLMGLQQETKGWGKKGTTLCIVIQLPRGSRTEVTLWPNDKQISRAPILEFLKDSKNSIQIHDPSNKDLGMTRGRRERTGADR